MKTSVHVLSAHQNLVGDDRVKGYCLPLPHCFHMCRGPSESSQFKYLSLDPYSLSTHQYMSRFHLRLPSFTQHTKFQLNYIIQNVALYYKLRHEAYCNHYTVRPRVLTTEGLWIGLILCIVSQQKHLSLFRGRTKLTLK